MLIDNRYEVIDQIGSGAGGEVYRVRDHNEGDEVALKILNATARFPLGPWAEAQILRHLSDHHILPIRNAYVSNGFPLIVTEIAQHGSIDGRINAEPLGLDVVQAIRWTRLTCVGVERAHERGLLHNDIKPANLFLTERNDCQVADFGFAGRIDPATGIAPAYGGTFETMAPEVAAAWTTGSMPTAMVASDVYSLAATAYWMLVGSPPHDLSGCATTDEKAVHVATIPVPRVRDVAPHVPDNIARIIDKALSRNPNDRPASAHQFNADLGRTLSGRQWRRTDEHSGHLACWRGTRPGTGGDYLLCMTQGKLATQRVLTATQANSGNKITRGCSPATQSNWPSVVRRCMRRLG